MDYEDMLDTAYDCIPIGRENAITKRELMRLLGLRHEREVRALVEELRNMECSDDYVIVSFSRSHGGYYKTNVISEIEDFVQETSHRIKSLEAILKKPKYLLSLASND